MRYAIVIEKAERDHSAFAPGLPGRVAAGATLAGIEREMRAAVRFHLDGRREDGIVPPLPASATDDVDA